MRLAGALLLLVGLIAAVVGTFTGCGSLFTWNGRHAVQAYTLATTSNDGGGGGGGGGGGQLTHTLIPEPGRHYTLSVQVVFDREGLEKRDGIIVVEAQMPLVAHVKDGAGTSLAEATGWVDPNAPPNVLYGQAAHETMRGPAPELAVERLIGPFIAASNAPLAVYVDLGPDRIGSARIIERRLVIHDDTLPTPIKRAFTVAAVGTIGFTVGVALLVIGLIKKRRQGLRRRTQRKRNELRNELV